ncbi:hypothetical protein J1N35_019579 [Gossypium stocksii]|uniref:Reverse transcriptase domain-containing protein n=1 Tax=Gossypium stocksii TaxID=47602 RepID=A0A9D3VSD1_9ROSI|nr:hypothetical protein J1N35_019579 [Gossypium stocksii]
MGHTNFGLILTLITSQGFSSEVFDHAYFGHVFTLSNHKLDRPIAKKHERVLVNAAWLRFLPHSRVEFATPGCSDHCPSIVCLERPVQSLAKPFQFFNFWAKHDRFLQLVAKSWQPTVVGDPMLKLFTKLKRLKSVLKMLNTEAFVKRNKHTVTFLFDAAGNWLKSFDQIFIVVLGFYQNLLGTVDSNAVECPDSLFQELLPKLSNNAYRVLNIPITNKDIKATILGRGIKKPLVLMVSRLSSSNLLGSTFIRGGSITDNTILAYELIRGYGRRHISPRCALKVDLQKAFDSLHWGFLLSILRAQGFPGKFLKWIEFFLTTPMFSVFLNGSLVGFF